MLCICLYETEALPGRENGGIYAYDPCDPVIRGSFAGADDKSCFKEFLETNYFLYDSLHGMGIHCIRNGIF